MTSQEKREFVSELVARIELSVFDDLKAGRVPEGWDGIELRWLLAERFAGASPIGTLYRKRRGSFKNHCIVNNL